MTIFGFSLGYVAAAALAGWAAVAVVRRLLLIIRLAGVPGPWATHFTHMPHSRAMLGGECHNWYAEMSRKYGTSAGLRWQCRMATRNAD